MDQRPKQARSMKTEQALLDTLEKLLEQKSFPELYCFRVGARSRTGDWRNLPAVQGQGGRAARRLPEISWSARGYMIWSIRSRCQITNSSCDIFPNSMQFTLRNIHLMRAANSLNDPQSFNLMTRARDVSAAWLAGRLRSSRLGAG